MRCEIWLRPREAFLVGDKPRDVDLGRNVGARVSGAHRLRNAGALIGIAGHYVVDDLPAAAAMIEQLLSARRRIGCTRSIA